MACCEWPWKLGNGMYGPCFGVLLHVHAQEMFMHNFGKAKPIDRSQQTDGSIDGSIDVSLHCEIVRYGTRKAETGRR